MLTDAEPPEKPLHGDWWSRRFGDRGVLQLLIGTDTEGIIVLLGFGSFCYLTIWAGYHEAVGSFIILLMFAVVSYFLAQLVYRLVLALLKVISVLRSERKD
jgi:hypothetical protein